MKKLKITFLLILIMLLLSATYVFAADVAVTLEGDKTAVAGETKTLTITLDTSSLDEDSVIAGMNATLTYSDNVSDVSISSADNSWGILSTNTDTGEFAATDGNQNGSSEILIIKYTVASDAKDGDTATISLTDISLSVAPAFETIYSDDVTATIEITEESSKTLTGIEVSSNPTTTDYEEGDYFSTDGMVITATYSDGTTAIITDYTYSPSGALTTDDTEVTISYTENGVTYTTTVSINVEEAGTGDGNNTNNNDTNDTNSNTNENDTNSNSNSNNNSNSNSNSSTSSGKNDDTTSTSSLPYTGSFKWILATVVVIGIIGGMCYIKFQKYKDI